VPSRRLASAHHSESRLLDGWSQTAKPAFVGERNGDLTFKSGRVVRDSSHSAKGLDDGLNIHGWQLLYFNSDAPAACDLGDEAGWQ